MNGTSNLSMIEFSNTKNNDDNLRIFTSKIDLKKVFSKKFKNKLNIGNNSQILKSPKKNTDNKNSQTILKKYDYNLNKIIKTKDLKESLNSITSLKNIHHSKDALSYKMDKIKFIINEKNKTMKNFYKKSNSVKSSKLHYSIDNKESRKQHYFIDKNNKYKKLKLRKNPIIKNMNIYSYKNHKNLENIGNDYSNFANEYIKSLREIINKNENKKEKNEINKNNNSSSKNSLLNKKSVSNSRKTNKKISLRNNLLKPKSSSIILKKNNWWNLKTEKSKIHWNNEILHELIININKNINQNIIFQNIGLSEDNFHYSQKIRMSTLLNLYNNVKHKSI